MFINMKNVLYSIVHQHLNIISISQQVLVFYRNQAANSGVSWLWPSGYLPNPWPDTTSVPEMLQFLEEHLTLRNSHRFFVTQ